MSFIHRPNMWVATEDGAATQLNYGLRVNPAPFTVSVPGEDPVLGSLEFVITNPSALALAVSSVTFTIQVGTGASLTPTTAGITTAISDTVNWVIAGPPAPITSGPATYTLQPATGTSFNLASGASVVVQIFEIQTNTTPGVSTVGIEEIVASNPGFINFQVTTFPAGFYFNGLAASVQSGSALVPVAQVNTGSTVTLVWNSSVVDTTAATIYYSNASQGQQQATPSTIGEWISPPLTSDTTFTVAITASGNGGEPLTMSRTTVVSVQNPSLVAASVTTGQATVTGAASVSGALTANAITATGVTVDGVLTANSAQISGTATANSVTAGSAAINGSLTANSAQISGTVSAGSGSISGNLQTNGLAAAFATVASAFNANGATSSVLQGAQSLTPGLSTWNTYQAYTDGFVIGYVGFPSSSSPGCVAWAFGATGNMLVATTGGNVGFFGPSWSSYMASNPNMFILPVAMNTQFSINLQQQTGSGQQANAPYAFYWVPLGTAQAPHTVAVANFTLPEIPKPAAISQTDERSRRADIVEFLEEALGRPIDATITERFLTPMYK